MELQNIIRELLHINNFVSLPGLGSFVKVYESARLSADGSKFIPPKQTFSFDTTRTFNDEAIEQFLQGKEGLSSVESTVKVKAFVENIGQRLKSGEAVNFDTIGELKMEKGGKIVLKPAGDDQMVSDTFGLDPLELPQPKQKNTVDKSSTSKPDAGKRSKKLIPALIAAIVILGLSLSAIWFFIPELRFWNEDLSVSNTQTEATEQSNQQVDNSNNAQVITSDSALVDVPSEQIAKSVDTKNDRKQALFYKEPQPQDLKTYYIIIGSYTSIENAQKHYNLLLSKGHRPEIIQGEKNYRVSLVKFTDRNRALTELERLRQQNPNESIWLLGQ